MFPRVNVKITVPCFLATLLIFMVVGQQKLSSDTHAESNNETMCDVCNCTKPPSVYVNCSDRQPHLQKLPTGFPLNIVQLDFSYNFIGHKFELPASLIYLYGQFNYLTDIFGMFNESVNIKIIYLQENRIRSIPPGTFAACHKLKRLFISDNYITEVSPESFLGLNKLSTLRMRRVKGLPTLKANLFRELHNDFLDELYLSFEELEYAEQGALNFSLSDVLQFDTGRLRFFPGGLFTPSNGKTQFKTCRLSPQTSKLSGISSDAFAGVRLIMQLAITHHRLTHIPPNLFENTELLSLDLSGNLLEDLPDGFLQSSPYLTLLVLYDNRLTHITKNVFKGLVRLERLYLFQNQITEIQPRAFAETSLTGLFVFNNNITSIGYDTLITRNSTVDQVYLYYNDIKNITDHAFDCLAKGGEVYYSRGYLFETPHFPNHVRMFGVGDNINISIPANQELQTNQTFQCFPCKPGTYGNRYDRGCVRCPAGIHGIGTRFQIVY
ncbi:podocan-like [Amphiura filiformis]|uniref:podocan-like n=1 Tax=Amphiura filiformis TaxID=82378 RepID=UPI003B226D15